MAAIFNFLLEVNKEEQVGTVLRVAGGWVRDTLLGIPSHDIDIAIETVATDPPQPLVTGEVFTCSIARFQAAHQLPTNTISVIRTNPEKSKHIETAQMTVMGMPLEFCHLRHDDYTSNSRVPTVRPGTPLEDALRRDYTVNALFYNLHTEMVEDFTTGLEDMEAKLLRTPLAPRETFLDDPLRLLRGIRFSGQLAYRLSQDVVQCAHDPTLVAMMRDKVSRERIGIEFGKMMGGNNPSNCGDLLLSTDLIHNTVLQEVYYKKGKGKSVTNDIEFIRPIVPSTLYEEGQSEALVALNTKLHQWSVDRLRFLLGLLKIPAGNDRVAVSCVAMLMPLALDGLLVDVSEASPTAGPAATVDERIAALVMMGLKQPSVVSDNAARILQGAMLLYNRGGADLLAALRSQAASSSGAACTSASVVFATGAARELLFDMLCQLNTKTMVEEGASVAVACYLLASGVAFEEVTALLGLFKKDLNLTGAPTGGVPLRGEDVATSLGVERKMIATYIMAQRRFLLHQPHATREEVIAYLQTLAL